MSTQDLTCQFCNKTLSTKSNLQIHQKTAKSCLKIQNKELEDDFKCEGCQRKFTQKINYNNHINICDGLKLLLSCEQKLQEKEKDYKTQYENQQVEYELKYEEQQLKHEAELNDQQAKYRAELNDQQAKYEAQLNDQQAKYEAQLKSQELKHATELSKQQRKYENQLKDQKTEYKTEIDKHVNLLERLAGKSTNTTTNNMVNHYNLAPMDITVEQVQDVLNEHFTEHVFHAGPAALAKILCDNLLKVKAPDGTIKNKLVCTDQARGMFKSLNKDNKTIDKDPKMFKLKNLLYTPVVESAKNIYDTIEKECDEKIADLQPPEYAKSCENNPIEQRLREDHVFMLWNKEKVEMQKKIDAKEKQYKFVNIKTDSTLENAMIPLLTI